MSLRTLSWRSERGRKGVGAARIAEYFIELAEVNPDDLYEKPSEE